MDYILDTDEWYLSALLILKNAALIVAVSLTTILVFRYAPQWVMVIAIVSLILFVLFLGRLVPRAWAMRDPERTALMLARPIGCSDMVALDVGSQIDQALDVIL